MPVWIFAFVPAIAAFLCAAGAWGRNKIVNIITRILAVLVPSVFYIAQLMYFRTFGSFASLSMIGVGGDALKNFGWGLLVTVRQSFGLLLLCILPVVVISVVLVKLSDRNVAYGAGLHGLALLAAILFWIAAVILLPLGGTESFSAYAAYHSTMVDTDSASSRIGVLPNSIVEAGGMLFGIKDPEDEEFAAAPLPDDMEIVEELPIETEAEEEPQTEEASAEIEAGPEVIPAEPEIDRSPNVIDVLDFGAIAQGASGTDVKDLCEYLDSLEGSAKNEYTGLFEGYNLIYICAESFSNYAIDKDVTPTLWKMANNGIVLDNFYNSFKNTTTNGEFALISGLWPDVTREGLRGNGMGTFAQTSDNSWPMALGTMFNRQCGCTSRAYHNYLGEYYRRSRCWPALGFECKFMDDGMKFTTSWPASDLEMMEQSVDDYINDERFCAYYMTFSGHGPYTSENVMYRWNIDKVNELLGERADELKDDAKGYLACTYELEKAMTYLLERLEEAGKLDNTLIVMAGDHYPYYLLEGARNSIAGHETDPKFEIYKSTCIMYCAGLEEPVHVDVPCCNVDILPTVYNLFGLEYDSRLFAGTDVFSDSLHIASLYNRSFVSGSVRYDSSTGEAEWLADISDVAEPDLQKYLDSLIAYVNTKYTMSLKIEENDFYKYLPERR